jgi:hypothetical protein
MYLALLLLGNVEKVGVAAAAAETHKYKSIGSTVFWHRSHNISWRKMCSIYSL